MTSPDLVDLAHTYSTPLLVIDESKLRLTVRRFRAAFHRDGWRCEVVYAAKALALKAIARIMYEEGLGLDVCSEGELQTAVQAGVPAQRCLVHGCAKSQAELAAAVRLGVGYIVVDNQPEIEALNALAQDANGRARVLVRLNIGTAAATTPAVQTSSLDSKFGFAINDGQARRAIETLCALGRLEFCGVHCHIGSQILELGSYAQEVERVCAFTRELERDCGIRCAIINLGGGLGIADASNAPSPEQWARVIFDGLEEHLDDVFASRQLMVEPGRSIIAPAGTTLYTIAVRKTLGNGEQALIVDGGMSDNPRPALYKATYPVTLAAGTGEPADGAYTIFGRHCETDLLFRDVALPDPQPGDVLAVHHTGAYTYSMASNYNRFPRPAVVLAGDGRAALIARRESLEHILALDV